MNTPAPLVVSSHGDLCGADVFNEVGGKGGEEVVVWVVCFTVGVVQDKHGDR